MALQRIKMLGQATHAAIGLSDVPGAIVHGREALAVAARLPEGARQSTDMRIVIAEARFSLGEALVLRAEATSLAHGERLALLREARALLDASLAFLGEARTRGLVRADEAGEQEVKDVIRRCDELTARLTRG
jgi:hypothetical protein